MSQRRERKAFTLVELLLVVTIIGILAGAVLVNFRGQTDRAKESRARNDIQTLETALNMHEIDVGDYPSSDQGLQALSSDSGAAGWNGPYLRKSITRDPWGNEYVYQYPGSKGIYYDLYSVGKDGQDGTEDDIGNWSDEDL